MASLLTYEDYKNEKIANYKMVYNFFLDLVKDNEEEYLSTIQSVVDDVPLFKDILIDFYKHINERPNFGVDTVFHALVLLTDYHTNRLDPITNSLRQSSVGTLREYSAEELFDLHRDTRTRELDERIRSSLSNQSQQQPQLQQPLPQPPQVQRLTSPQYFARSGTPFPKSQVQRSIDRVLVFPDEEGARRQQQQQHVRIPG